MVNIKQFILVPTASHCNFCQTATQIDGDDPREIRRAICRSNATQNEIKLGGKFKIDRDQAANPFGGLPYQLEADFLQE